MKERISCEFHNDLGYIHIKSKHDIKNVISWTCYNDFKLYFYKKAEKIMISYQFHSDLSYICVESYRN